MTNIEQGFFDDEPSANEESDSTQHLRSTADEIAIAATSGDMGLAIRLAKQVNDAADAGVISEEARQATHRRTADQAQSIIKKKKGSQG